jgi:hypothetical protein
LENIQAIHSSPDLSPAQSPLGSWQSKNWDPAVGSTQFDDFCAALSAPLGKSNVTVELPFNHPERMIAVTDGFSVDLSIFNYAKYIKQVCFSA